jgi:hypothetical protein
MLTLGHLAAASGAVEARCAYLLIAHAASKSEVASENSCGSPRAHASAQSADILSRLARSLGYASRRAFVARHRRAIGALWIRAGISVTRLFAVPELTATSDADAESPRALARSWTAALLPPAVLANNEDAARRVADARGESAEALLRENVACVFAQLFPASLSTSEARRRVAAAAKAALRGDLMIRAAGSAAASHVDALFFRHLTAAACEMLALAEPGGAESRGDGRGGRRRGDQGAYAAALHPRGVEARGRGASGRVREEHGSPSVRGRRRVQDGGGEGKVVDVDGRSAVPVFARGAPRAGRRAPPSPPQASPRRVGRPDRSPRRRGAAPVDVSPRDPRAAAARRRRGRSAPRRRACWNASRRRPLARGDWRGVPGGADGLSAEALADVLQPVASTLVAAAEARDGRSRRAADAAAKALSRVLAGAGAASQSRRVRAAAAALTPPPRDVPRLDAAVEAHARATRGVPMPERLGAFVAKAPGLPPSLRRAAIRAGVREALERAREIREGGAAAARDAWRLAALATASGDETQMARAGELLAAIGPLSFGHDDSVVRSGLPGAPFAEPSTRGGGGGGSGGGALAAAAAPDAEDPAFAAAALRILSGLLCDSSSATVQLAASTTRLVLASRAARSAWDKHLSPLERAFLAPLAPADDADPEEAERDALRKSEAAASRDETHSPARRD